MNPVAKRAKDDAAKEISMAHIFGDGGLLAKRHQTFEFRRGQLEMAEIVEEAFAKHQHALIEAGTGTGKTLAYLLPAIRSGRRVVISTATKSLQEQLYHKDIPFLQKHFAPDLKVALMKGRNNFLCRHKVHLMAGQPVLKGIDEVDWFAQIRDWEKLTETGDRAELNFLPDDADLWHRLDARSDTCTGQKCDEFQNCFITSMHQRAQDADVIIVNHHLFFADLAIRQDDFGAILPEYSAVIFDEAHEIEDVASDYFGRAVSSYKFDELARDAEQTLKMLSIDAPSLRKAVTRMRDRAHGFFEFFGSREGRHPFEPAERATFVEQHREPYEDFTAALKRVEAEMAALPAKPEEIVSLARRAMEARRELTFLLETDEKNYVYWFERRGRGVFLAATPIDVSAILREKLFEQFDTVVLTSATLAVAGHFDYLKQRLGLDMVRERVLPQEFDFREQAVLYIPEKLPDVRDASFPARAAEEIVQLLEITEGRAFCLFFSGTRRRKMRRRLPDRSGYPRGRGRRLHRAR